MAVAHENKFHASPRDGYVHTAQVVQEADLSVLVAPHQTNEDDVAFLPLESVYGVYAQQVAVGFEKGIPAEQGAQQLHLAFVRDMIPVSMRSANILSLPIFWK